MSNLQEEIKKAIGAHGLWKTRLKDAIDSSKISGDISNFSKDNLCDFGKWLYSDSMKAYKSNPNFLEVQKLHSEFHSTVGKTLSLVQSGKKSDAEKMLSPSGEFTSVSQKLVSALMKWNSSPN